MSSISTSLSEKTRNSLDGALDNRQRKGRYSHSTNLSDSGICTSLQHSEVVKSSCSVLTYR